MKIISTRQELAEYVNIRKVACVSIDLSTKTQDKWQYAKGDKIKCGFNTRSYGEMTTRGNIYTEQGKWYVSQDALCIHDGEAIWKSEAIKMMEWQHTPTVREGDEVVVICYYGNDESLTVPVVFTVGKVNSNCSTVCELQ